MDNKRPIEKLRDMLGHLKNDAQWLYRYGDPVNSISIFKQLTRDDQKRLLCLALIEDDNDIKNVARYLLKRLDPATGSLEQLLNQMSTEDQAEVKGISTKVLHNELPDKSLKSMGIESQQQLPEEWKTIRVFISSTFQDMHDERDYLVKIVFPELRERCAKKHLHLIDLDLRWGVTKEEAEHGKIINIILEEIDCSRPFFIAILGERYGSLIDNISGETKFTYPWLTKYEEHSFTALEIVHGVLRNPELSRRSFFYFRNPQFILKVPEIKRSDYLAENTEAESKLAALKDKIHASGRPVMENYPCRWDNAKGGLVDLDIFGQKVLNDLWNAICEEYPEGVPETDQLTTERQMHEIFAEERSTIHIGRLKQEERLTEYVQGTDRRPVVITGESGCGKSAFLASWSKKYITDNPDVFILTYFIGASPSSTNYHLLLYNMCEELKRKFKLKQEIPEDDKKLSETLALFLLSASRVKSRIVLVLDALDQLSQLEGVNNLSWLLDYIPEKTRLVLSSLEGGFLDVLRRHQVEEITLPPLTADEQRQIVQTVLSEWHRKLDNNQIEALLAHSGVNNSLYLRVALEELRLFSSFDKLTLKINRLAEDIPGLFGQVLERFEEDHGQELAEEAFSLIGSSRYGLSETELLEMLRRKDEEQFPCVLWVRLVRSSKPYLVYRGELIGFFHRQLSDAVSIRYLKKDNKHKKLAAYFSDSPLERKLDEYPYQLHQAMEWKGLAAALSDLNFFSYAWEHNSKYEWMEYWRSIQGSFEPGSCYQASIEARERTEGKTTTLALLLYIGRFLHDMGLLTSSLPFKKQALSVAENTLGSDHPDVANSLNSLALLRYAQGRYSEAELLYKRALAIWEKALGPDHPNVANSLNGLALICYAQGRYSEAELLYKRALLIAKKTLGPDHPDVATSLNNLALLYYIQGRYIEAEPLCKCALEIREKILGPDHPDVAASLNNLAPLYQDQGRYNEAETLYKRALQIKENTLGPDHPYMAASLNNLALLYNAQGRYSDTEPLYKRALSIAEKALGSDHPHVAASLNNLASLYQNQGKYNEAETLYKRALAIAEKKLGFNHPNTELCRRNLKICQDAVR